MRKFIKIVVTVIALCHIGMAGAQEPVKKDSVLGFNAMDYLIQDIYRFPDKNFRNKHLLDNTYVRIGGGMFQPNRTGENAMKWMQDYHLSIGKNLSTKHGFRLGVSYGKSGLKDENLLFKQYAFNLDYLFNATAYLLGYDPDRKFEVAAVLGAGYVKTLMGDEKHQAPEGHLGLELRYKLGPQAYIALEPMVKITDGYMQDNWRNVGLASGATLSYIQYLRPLTSENTSSRYTKMSPYFIELATGLQFQNLNHGWWNSRGGSYMLNVGRWLSDAFGVRAGGNFAFNRISNTPVDGLPQNHDAFYADGRFDFMLNPLAFITKNNPKSWGGFHLLGGILYGYAKPYYGFSDGYSYSGYSTGLQGWLRLQDNLQLFMEPRVSFISSEHDNPYLQMQETLNETLFNLNLGLRLNYSTWDERKVRYESNGLFSPSLFFQMAGGVSYSALRQSTYAGNGGPDFSGRLSAGYRFSPYHAVRANVDMTRVENKDVYGGKQTADFKTVSLDYMLRLSNLMQEGDDKARSLAVDWYAGPVWNWDSNLLGAHTGFVAKKRVNAHTSLFVQPEVQLLPKHVQSPMLQNNWNPFFNVYAGVEYAFKDGKDFINGLFPQARNHRVGLHSPFFVETALGTTALLNAEGSWSSTIGSTVRTAIGTWINPAVAVRLSAETAWNPVGDESHQHLVLGGADVVFNPLGMWKNYQYDSRWGLNLVAGGNYGLQNRYGQAQQTVFGASGGIQMWTKLMKHTRFFVEPRYSHLWTENSTAGGKGHVSALVGMVMDYVAPKRRVAAGEDKPKFEDKGMFFDVQAGAVTNHMKLGPTHEGKVLNSVWGFGTGYRFTPISSVRLGFDSQKYNEGLVMKERWATSLAYMLNLSNLLSGYDPSTRFSTEVYAGPMGYYNKTGERFVPAVIAGMRLSYRMNEIMSLHFSPEFHTAFYSGYTDKRAAYKVGISYNMHAMGTHLMKSDWFFEASTGVQMLTNSMIEASETLGQVYKLGVGTWMNSTFGVRFAGTASVNKYQQKPDNSNRYVQFYSLQPSVLFDPLNLLASYYRGDAKAGLFLFGGPVLGICVVDKGYKWKNVYSTGFNAGMQAWVKVGENQRLFVEPMYSMNALDRLAVNVGMSVDMTKKQETAKDSYELKPFFVQAGAGNASDFYNSNRMQDTGLNLGFELTAGYRFNTQSAVRLSVGYIPAKSGVTTADDDLSVAYQVNLSNLFLGENSARRLSLEAFAGLSFVNKKESVLSLGGLAGFQANFHMNDKLYLFASPEIRLNHTKNKTLFGVGYNF